MEMREGQVGHRSLVGSGRLIICGDPLRSPSVDTLGDRAADTVDVELLLQLHIRGDPYLRAHRCTIISAPSVLVRGDGAINGEPVTGLAVVTGEQVASVGQVVVGVSTSPVAFALGPLLTITPNDAVSVRVAATNPLVCVQYKDHVRLFGQNHATTHSRYSGRHRVRHDAARHSWRTPLLARSVSPPAGDTPSAYGSLDAPPPSALVPRIWRRRPR
ncbi:unnamed protein product (mitochondrion) [Plasmodiophora brassicae]|uniref:Uncharacterized protein n=1 Tax=Plasmodiophora brassicae TaxID=37360 RepID=A0A3P3YKK3_PLABS|nr:unnamed protein product [Plasmodiophora brassicae]